jgi:hypothetical protein
MDPYLESPVNWQDFHATFVLILREAISDQLPANYYARVDEFTIALEPELLPSKRFRPDVSVIRNPDLPRGGLAVANVAAVAGILELENLSDYFPHSEIFIELVHVLDREVVTVLELFSPTNKVGEGRAKYFEKREKLMRSNVHVVELDFLRAGKRIALNRPLPNDDYFVFISPGNRRPKCEILHWTIRQPLPSIPIPLRDPDPSITIDLQAVFRTTYERGRYWRMIDYTQSPPAPPLEPPDAEWAAGLVRKASA